MNEDYYNKLNHYSQREQDRLQDEKYRGYNSPYKDEYKGKYSDDYDDYDDYKAYSVPKPRVKTEAEIAEDKRVAKAVSLARQELDDENYLLQDTVEKAEAARYLAEKKLAALQATLQHVERPLFAELATFLNDLVDTTEVTGDDVEAWAFQDGHNEVIHLLQVKIKELDQRS